MHWGATVELRYSTLQKCKGSEYIHLLVWIPAPVWAVLCWANAQNSHSSRGQQSGPTTGHSFMNLTFTNSRLGKLQFVTSGSMSGTNPESDLIATYLIDKHAWRHGETGPRREVTGDHDPHSGLREGQLVGVGRQQLIHHQHWRLTVEVRFKQMGKKEEEHWHAWQTLDEEKLFDNIFVALARHSSPSLWCVKVTKDYVSNCRSSEVNENPKLVCENHKYAWVGTCVVSVRTTKLIYKNKK